MIADLFGTDVKVSCIRNGKRWRQHGGVVRVPYLKSGDPLFSY